MIGAANSCQTLAGWRPDEGLARTLIPARASGIAKRPANGRLDDDEKGVAVADALGDPQFTPTGATCGSKEKQR